MSTVTSTVTSTVACARCGERSGTINGWWLRDVVPRGELRGWLCPVCTAVITADDSDHGDEHVESIADSAALHANKITHQTRSCRVCLSAGASLRPNARWTAGA